MQSMQTRRARGNALFGGYLPVLVALGAILSAGCAAKSEVLKLQFSSEPYYYTDEASRKLALRTFSRGPDLYTNYRIGPEDVLEISIFEWELREETKSVEVRVAANGTISLPVIGELMAQGLSVEEVQAKIEQRFRDWQIISTPRVSVVVQQFRSKRVSIVGAVMDPGTYTLRTNVTTLLDVLGLAGGPDVRAGQVAYVVLSPEPANQTTPAGAGTDGSVGSAATQGQPGQAASPGVTIGPSGVLQTAPSAATPQGSTAGQAQGQAQVPFGFVATMPGRDVIAIDLYQLLELGDLSLNVVVGDGDVIYVPEAKRFFVIGFVRYPGGFPIKKPTNLLEGVAVAQGVREEEASVRHCALTRKTPEGTIIIPVDLRAIAKGEEPNLYLQPDDIIDVRQTGLRLTMLYIYNTITRVLNFGLTGRVFD